MRTHPGGLLHPHLGGLGPGTSPVTHWGPAMVRGLPASLQGDWEGNLGRRQSRCMERARRVQALEAGGVRRVGGGFLGMGGSVRQIAPRSRGGGEDLQETEKWCGRGNKGWMGNVEVAESHIQAFASQAPATQPPQRALGNSPLTWRS